MRTQLFLLSAKVVIIYVNKIYFVEFILRLPDGEIYICTLPESLQDCALFFTVRVEILFLINMRIYFWNVINKIESFLRIRLKVNNIKNEWKKRTRRKTTKSKIHIFKLLMDIKNIDLPTEIQKFIVRRFFFEHTWL